MTCLVVSATAAEAAHVPVSDNADAGAMDWPALVDASTRVLGRWLSESCSPSAP